LGLERPKGHAAGRAEASAVRELIALFTRHRELTWELTKREIGQRYAGQAVGSLWAVIHPLASMGVYIFLFAFVFKAKVGDAKHLPLDYITYLLSGLVPWMAFIDSMNKSAVALSGNANLVKQVVFPIEILPVKAVLASMVTQVISTVILILYVVVKLGYLPVSYAWLPVLFVVQFFAMTGVAYALSAVGAYLKDIKDVVQMASFIGMYTVPIVYLLEWVPEKLQPVFYANPFSYLAWIYQDACYHGRITRPEAWIVFPLGSVLTLVLGYRVFRRLKIGFGNVL